MAVTVANIITNVDTYFGDSSTDRISQAERFQAITEATAWLLEELGNDHAIKTYTLDYLDTIHYYKVTSGITDLLASADLRRAVDDHTISALHKSSKDLAEDIGQNSLDFAWSIERRNADTFVVVNLDTKNKAKSISDFDSSTDGGGTWSADTSGSDATNVTFDTVEFKSGSASLNFDLDVSQSGNDYATIQNTTLTQIDLSDWEDLGAWLFEAYIPDATNITSYTLFWGSDTSNYWSATKTTDIDGSAWTDGWNTVKVNWSDATATGSPDATAIDYIAIRVTYDGAQADDTDFRLDNLRIAKPETLTYHYVSWDVGEDTNGTDISAFSATTDVPFFSGKYDQYKYPVAHKAASILFYSIRLREEAASEERMAEQKLDRLRDIFPDSKTAESHNFKVFGINFSRGGRRRLRGI